MGFLDIDELAGLSEEEIEKRLADGAEHSDEKDGTEEALQEDILDMLQDSQDSDLSDIKDMLERSDSNRVIGEDPIPEKDDSRAERLRADIEAAGTDETEDKKMSGRKERALEKKRRKEEKKAAKAAKKAMRGSKKGGKRNALPESEDDFLRAGSSQEPEEYDLTKDKALLDSIVSEAGKRAEKKQQDSLASLEKAGLDTGNDMADLLSGLNDIPDIEENPAPSEPVMELDMDEVDAFVPDITGTKGEDKEAEKEQDKKKGLLHKLVALLTEEEEPEEENEDIRLSEENQEILDELDEEAAAGARGKEKKKKGKAPKKKADKKKADKKKAPKPPKPKKPPKEKKPKEAEPYVPGKKLTFRKMLPVLLLGATIGVVLFLFVNLAVDFSVKSEAAAAYKAGDYETCYLKLYGKKLNEEQEKMYGKSESILQMRLLYREYEVYMGNDAELEAVDSLIQAVADYPALLERAAGWDAAAEVGEVYSTILNILSTKYGVTEQRAQEIAALESDIKYTLAVTALVEGDGYQSEKLSETDGQQAGEAGSDAAAPEGGPAEVPGNGASEEQPEDGNAGDLEDMLPEESDLGGGDFVDNQ